MGILPASKWRFLRHLSLADNAMTSIPLASLAPLSNTLFSLDLSSNLFSQIPDSLATLTALRALNLSHCMIDSLHSLVRSPLPAITALNLRANRLQSLAGVEKLYPLERLDLRDNQLADPLELARLTGIPDLREIWVEGNPFARTHKDHRVAIFNLFRATPGYTVDPLIDGHGPTYSERRLLLDRAPIPDSVPVVKPKPSSSEAPAVVDVGKPTIVYGAAATTRESGGGLLRKERPVAKTVTSEVGAGSGRRRKSNKRRIVDLARGDAALALPPLAVDVARPEPLRAAAPPPDDSPTGNYRISRPTESLLLPPVTLSESRREVPSTVAAAADVDLVLSCASRESADPAAGMDPQDWDVGGEIYRRKIQTLRDRVGSGYLSVLSEESWDGTGSFNAGSSPSVPPLRAGHLSNHSLAPPQAVHSGRTVG
ncbi:hypothetical protein CDD83_3584 [Cordyceps sp. RAO-2017]|nr:hypothetical protein CDD83_3584 [Cordyceps sp. RAO-2017]